MRLPARVSPTSRRSSPALAGVVGDAVAGVVVAADGCSISLMRARVYSGRLPENQRAFSAVRRRRSRGSLSDPPDLPISARLRFTAGRRALAAAGHEREGHAGEDDGGAEDLAQRRDGAQPDRPEEDA